MSALTEVPQQQTSRRKLAVLIVSCTFGAFIVIGTLLYARFADPLLRTAIASPWASVLSQLTEAPRLTDGFNFDRLRTDGLFALGILACVAGWVLSVMLIYYHRTWHLIRNFFSAEAHPLTLALFRVVLFTFAAFVFSRDHILRFSDLPQVFLEPPVGMNWLLSIVPVNVEVATWAYTLFVGSSLLAAVGAYTRIFAIISVVLGLYVLGIPNFFGKVDHYNSLIWFMALMAVSPCSDTLSIDALRRAWRDPSWTPRPSRAYALPIRFIWILMGVCYFFPGLYKLATGGFAWILSENFRYIMFKNWVALGGWVPPLRLDSVPLLYRTGAAAATAFELSFLLLILVPRLRPLAAVVGFSFHNLTHLVMRIPFYSLQIAYLTFVDWHRVFTWLGRQLYPQLAHLTYDANTVLGRSLATLKVLDLFNRVTYSVGRDGQEPCLTVGKERKTGLVAVRGLCARSLLLWPLLPFLLIAPRPWLGQHVRRSARPLVVMTSPSRRTNAKVPLTPIVLVGSLLVSVNLAFGLLRINAGWPFALYPIFGGISEPTAQYLQVAKVTPGGEEIVDLAPVIENYGYQKLPPIVKMTLSTQDPMLRDERFEALWSLLVLELDALEPLDEVRLYYATYNVDPELWEYNPTSRELIAEFAPRVQALQK